MGVAPKAPSSLLKVLGVLCYRVLYLNCFPYQEACQLGTAFAKLRGEHEALKKKNDEDNGMTALSYLG